MMTKRVFIYAFDERHKIVRYEFLKDAFFSVKNLRLIAEWTQLQNIDIRRIYAVDDRPGLYKSFLESYKAKDEDFVKHLEFEDLVSREGILIISV